MGLYDLKRSHYDCVCNLANEIATHLSGARNDNEVEKGLAMTLLSVIARSRRRRGNLQDES
jgi:hypothetical protein